MSKVSVFSFFFADNIHDLVEILMQKQNMNEPLGIHQVERRRGPQLRLRFGKRTDEFDPFGINDVSYKININKFKKKSLSIFVLTK